MNQDQFNAATSQWLEKVTKTAAADARIISPKLGSKRAIPSTPAPHLVRCPACGNEFHTQDRRP